MIQRSALLLVVVVGFSALLLATPEGAFAHAEYESSTPGRNEVVQQPPSQVEVIFTQEVFRSAGGNFVRVFNEANTQVSEGDGTIDDVDRTRITTTLQPNLPAGLYVVQWQTLSDEDGDSDDGAFCFYVQSQPTAAQQATCAAFDEDEEEPTPTPGAATATAGAEPTASTGTDDDDSDSSGTATGVIVGVVIAVAVVGGGILFWVRRSRA